MIGIYMEKLDECPLCGSKNIRHIKEDLKRTYRGVPYVARDIEYVRCLNCGDEIIDYEMCKRKESFRPDVPKKG